MKVNRKEKKRRREVKRRQAKRKLLLFNQYICDHGYPPAWFKDKYDGELVDP